MSLRAAIDAKCKDCIYDPRCSGGTWREQVAQCTALSCPLWPYRTGPMAGPWKDYPVCRDTVPTGWLVKPVGWAKSGHPLEIPGTPR